MGLLPDSYAIFTPYAMAVERAFREPGTSRLWEGRSSQRWISRESGAALAQTWWWALHWVLALIPSPQFPEREPWQLLPAGQW